MLILWPLVAAAALSISRPSSRRPRPGTIPRTGRPTTAVLDAQSSLLPLYYTLFGAIIAFGIGKVGAYANYFLEFYAGLIWLAAIRDRLTTDDTTTDDRRLIVSILARYPRWFSVLGSRSGTLGWFSVLVPLLVIGALLRYYPTLERDLPEALPASSRRPQPAARRLRPVWCLAGSRA